jgi:hypothetical protein
MTPRDVDQLHPDEYRAMVAYMVKEAREHKRAAQRARRGR